MHIFSVPLPIVYNILKYLSVEEVWEIRTVSKTFYHICTNYFKENLEKFYVNETWLYTEVFGRTIEILHTCTNLKILTIELKHSISTDKVFAMFNNLLKSDCQLSECSLQGFTIPESFPNIAENFLTIRKLCLVDLACSDWQSLFVCLLRPNTQYISLQHVSLQLLPQYDGVDLLYLGTNCPNMLTLNVSYCSQLRREYLETALRGWSKLQSLHCLYVPCVRDSTVLVLCEYCPSLVELCVCGTQVTLNTLITLSRRNVTIDILEDSQFTVPPKLPLQS